MPKVTQLCWSEANPSPVHFKDLWSPKPSEGRRGEWLCTQSWGQMAGGLQTSGRLVSHSVTLSKLYVTQCPHL